MIDLYTMRSESPHIQKILMMLNLTGLPYTVKSIDKRSDGKYPEEFLLVSPNATVPAIVDTDTGARIFESGAILYYLAEKSGKLLPGAIEKRADVMKWLMFEMANVAPTIGEMYHYTITDSGDLPDAVFQRYQNRLLRYCTILDQQLSDGKEYLCGEFSIADLALYPWSAILEDFTDINLQQFPHLNRWVATISKDILPHQNQN